MKIPNQYIQLSDFPIEEQPTLIRDFFKSNGLDPYLLTTTVGKFLNIIKGSPYHYDLNEHTNMTMNGTIFYFGDKPRKYSYDVEYINTAGTNPNEYFYEDKRKFFEATKIFYFLKNPVSKFRTPFYLVNTPYTNNKNTLHGLFRTMMLPRMPTDTKLSLIVFDKKIVEYSKSTFNSCENLLSLSNNELENSLNLKLFVDSELYIFHSLEVGTQIIEPHSVMPEFQTNWEVEFTGTELIVNDHIVATRNGEQFTIVKSM